MDRVGRPTWGEHFGENLDREDVKSERKRRTALDRRQAAAQRRFLRVQVRP